MNISQIRFVTPKWVVSAFESISEIPPDPILNLSTLYKADDFEKKVDLGVGAYRDGEGKPWILPVVSKAENIVINRPGRNHEYLPVGGFKEFTTGAARIAFGEDSEVLNNGLVYSIQSISGTGSLSLGGMFLSRFYNSKNIFISKPTWVNHHDVFSAHGFEIGQYAYWDPIKKSLDFDGFVKSIREAPEGSVFVLHACAHNPTGVDPSKEQWAILADEIAKKKHFPFFDMAYQGYATGDLDNDAYAVRLFASRGFELLLAQSFAKNMGLYGERTGCLHILTNNKDATRRAGKQTEKCSRATVSTCPRYGAEIAGTILSSPELFDEWKQTLKQMSGRVLEMRHALRDRLVKLGTPGNWDHIVNQIGMFSFTGISYPNVQILVKKYHIYLADNGRISVAGLNHNNIDYVANSIHEVISTNPTPASSL
ncbi:Aspartate aminotransferase, cytoplasmic [Smittium mucronatum]|uniref:aspartate transaminase n=1 Tax=Smittium mucronatum TaxID=133383 RepID=A0A1R0H130_9FUNG|nr:Aspartate aminotransferase, cytoplasmic [Smittium mucronatum]